MKNRQNIRQSIDLVATLHASDTAHDILISDISLGGVRFQLRKDSQPLPLENEVILDVPLFKEIRAQIIWNDDAHHGIEFLECPPCFIRFMESILGHPSFNENNFPATAHNA